MTNFLSNFPGIEAHEPAIVRASPTASTAGDALTILEEKLTMATKTLPSRALASEFLEYDRDAVRDAFTWNHRDRRHFASDPEWRRWNSRYAGKPAGGINAKGYLTIVLKGTTYRAHRLAWLLIYGEPVPEGIDHKNSDKLDNRISNLRTATQAENMANSKINSRNKTGIKGVDYNRKECAYMARISINGKRIFLGIFNTIKEAAEARREAAIRLHGAFARHD